MLYLDPIRARALALRDPNAKPAVQLEAFKHASGDLLALCREVEQLRAAISPYALDLADRLAALRLVPIDEGPLEALMKTVAGRLCAFALKHAPPSYADQSQAGLASGPEAIGILKVIDAYLQCRLHHLSPAPEDKGA